MSENKNTDATSGDEYVIMRENPMPAPPKKSEAAPAAENPMPTEPTKAADEFVILKENPMPAPPALGLDNK